MVEAAYGRRLLEGYISNKATAENYPFELEMINSRLYAAGNDKLMIDLIEAKDRLAARTAKAKGEIEKTERALRSITAEQRQLLDAFYIMRAHSGADTLADKLNMERSSVYREKNKALSAFCRLV